MSTRSVVPCFLLRRVRILAQTSILPLWHPLYVPFTGFFGVHSADGTAFPGVPFGHPRLAKPSQTFRLDRSAVFFRGILVFLRLLLPP